MSKSEDAQRELQSLARKLTDKRAEQEKNFDVGLKIEQKLVADISRIKNESDTEKRRNDSKGEEIKRSVQQLNDEITKVEKKFEAEKRIEDADKQKKEEEEEARQLAEKSKK